MINKILVIFATAMVLGGCASNQRAAGPSGLPDWVINPPKENDSYIYGVGQANELTAAKLNAQSEIAGKIEVQVNSDVHVVQSLQNDTAYESVISRVNTAVERMHVKGFSFDKTVFLGGDFWVLASLSKDVFFGERVEQFLANDKTIHLLMDRFYMSTKIRRVAIGQQAREAIERGKEQVSILIAYSKLPHKNYLRQYAVLESDIKGNLRTVNIDIEVDGPHAEALKGPISGVLNKYGITSSNSGDGTLLISAIPSHFNDGGANNVQLVAIFTLFDSTGNQVSSRQFSSSGRSYQSKADAVQKAVMSIQTQFESQGLIDALGLEE